MKRYEPIRKFIHLTDKRNTDLSVTNLVGLTIEKRYIPSVANVIGTDLSKYKVIKQGQFACSLMQVSRDGKMPVAMYKGEPQNDIGILSDVMDNCTKSDGMKMLIRSMSPEIIVCDEIGNKQDIEAINYAMCSGVKGIFTAHGNSLEEIMLNEQISQLLKKYIVQVIIILDDKRRGEIKSIYKLQNKSYIKVLN